jgi:hypothetical protein
MPAAWRLDLTKNPSPSPAVHFHHGLLANPGLVTLAAPRFVVVRRTGLVAR